MSARTCQLPKNLDEHKGAGLLGANRRGMTPITSVR